MLLLVITYIADLLSLLWKNLGEMEILEHMKVLKGKGKDDIEEHKPSAAKVWIVIDAQVFSRHWYLVQANTVNERPWIWIVEKAKM